MIYNQEKFLLKVYRELYKKDSVIHSGDKSDDKFNKIKKYLNRIDNSSRVYDRNSDTALKYLKNRYHDKYVIKKENIPSDKNQEVIVKRQKESLGKCIDYFLFDTRDFPIWVRYWAFQGIVKMGSYNVRNNSFYSRGKGTIASFLILTEVNKDIIKDTMQKAVDYINGYESDDKYLNTLLDRGNFSDVFSYNRKIYMSYLREKFSSMEVDGMWQEFPRGSDVSLLHDRIMKNVTHWCIEDRVVLEEYNKKSDLLIYFVKDDHGDYNIPKLAIVMCNGVIQEIRGTFDNYENIDDYLIPVIESKLGEMSYCYDFDKKLESIKKLCDIYNKNKKGISLSKEELRFLYEIDEKFEYFGRFPDSRFYEIRNSRNIKKDYAVMFNCSSNEVGNCLDDLMNVDKNLEVYIGDIKFEDLDLPKLSIPRIVFGNVECPYVQDISGFDKLEVITGNAIFNYLENPLALDNLRYIYGDAYFVKLKEPLRNLQFVGGREEFNFCSTSKHNRIRKI